MLSRFLENKPLYYDEIDYSRMPRVYETIRSKLKLPKIIHIVGTNGKGTTGRFLARALFSKNYSVGHYTSPHILAFNERIWLNGENISTQRLDSAHEDLLLLLSKEDADSLSYFEYTTLLAIYIYRECEYVVLEAGLGGEHDATAVFENILTLVTPIDRDHEAFLGTTIREIARTKLNAIQKKAIIASQKHQEVYEVAAEVSKEKSVSIERVSELLSIEDTQKIEQIAQNNSLAPYLKENLSLGVSALKSLNISYSVEDFNNSKLYGRLSQLSENIILDVGHNPLAANSIYESLKGSKYTLVYNSFRDKNYREILTILKPIIQRVEIIAIEDERAESSAAIQTTLKELGLESKLFEKIDVNESYLVFGSFSVAEAFLKVYND